MRESLKNLVNNSVCLEYTLPNSEKNIDKSALSTREDFCFKNENFEDVAKIIYNGIVEYALNEFKIDYDNLSLEQRKVISTKMRYDKNASDDEKQKYGFYGEVLIDLILRCCLKTKVLLARGYLYSPIENSETKGFDAFHLMKNSEGEDELWLGEAKFYIKYKKPITDVLEKLAISFSNKYLQKNLLAIVDESVHITTSTAIVDEMVEAWNDDPDVDLSALAKSRKLKLVYPILITYESSKNETYEQNIQKCIDHINIEYQRLRSKLVCEVEYSLFFIFLPVEEVSIIKRKVFEWIDNREPLIL